MADGNAQGKDAGKSKSSPKTTQPKMPPRPAPDKTTGKLITKKDDGGRVTRVPIPREEKRKSE